MIIRGNYRNILVVLPALFIMLFAFAIVLPAVPASTYAEGDTPNEGITIVISPEINASLISSENGDYKIVKDTVTIGTDALNGYTLYISTDTPDHQTLYLNGDTSSENRINGAAGTYESPKTLGDYEWGFAVPGIGHFDNTYSAESPNENSKFAILPTENKIIRNYTTSTSEDAAKVYYGFKLGGTIEPGEYETNITYTAIPATQPLTAKAVLGSNNNLNFVYDRKTYTVGETYADNLGETTITNIYDNIPMSGIAASDNWPWAEQSDSVFTLNFDGSFANARPTSMLRWFRNLRKLSTITNHQNLNTSMVNTMYQAFVSTGRDVDALSLDLSGWDTSNVSDMTTVFGATGEMSTSFSLNLDGWNTSNVTTLYGMFYRTGFSATDWTIGDISSWDTSKVANFYSMFNRAGNSAAIWNIGNLDNWKTGNAENMSAMFGQAGSSATAWNIGDISGWDTGKVTDMSWMFNQAGRDADVWDIGNLGSWKTGNVTDMSYMFSSAGRNATAWNIGNLDNWDTSSVTDMNYMFDYAGRKTAAWTIGDISKWDVSNVTTMEKTFYKTGTSTTTWDIGDLNYVDEGHKGWDVSSVANHSDFVDWSQSNIDTSKLPWQSN